MKDLVDFIRVGTTHIKGNHMKTAGEEVYEYARLNPGLSHEEFVSNVGEMLSQKFYYRYWLIVSYRGDTYGSDYHEIDESQYSYHFFREFNRCVYMSSTNNHKNIGPKLEMAVNHMKNRKVSFFYALADTASNVYNMLSYYSKPYNGLAVIWVKKRVNDWSVYYSERHRIESRFSFITNWGFRTYYELSALSEEVTDITEPSLDETLH